EIELHRSSLPRVARFSSDSAKKSAMSEDLRSKTTPWEIGHFRLPSSIGVVFIGNICHLEKSSDIVDFLAFLL
ncbi:MAG: hypothetical protein IKE20_02840, partial [Eggerthellaceae bacterium]|nr:hypothetical protein [Eggerthellaceae bacterium]